MTDWTTVLVAAISASAALGGSFVTSLIQAKNQDKAHRREDAASLRVKFEEFAAAIDAAYAQNAEINTVATLAAAGRAQRETPKLSPLELGRIRSMIAIYFPECREALLAFDESSRLAHERFRANETGDITDLNVRLGVAIIETCRLAIVFFDAVRASFPEIGARISA